MACGTPIVAARSSAVSEVVGNAALTVDPRDPRELAMRLDTIPGEHANLFRAPPSERGPCGGIRQRGSLRSAGFVPATTTITPGTAMKKRTDTSTDTRSRPPRSAGSNGSQSQAAASAGGCRSW